MSGPFGSQQWMYASGGFYDHPINQSLRFNEGDFPYLQRTPSSAGNRRTYTYSVWVKRGTSTDYPSLFNSRVGSTAPWTLLHFHNTDEVRFNTSVDGTTQYPIITDAKFRDHSAWYHIVYAVDTTQATASNRVKIYVNGVQQSVTGTYPPQNFDTAMNLAQTHQIGANLGATSKQNFDGYMAEVNFVDGQALDASSFGETKSGVWIPKKYSGSYGTNGFYLNFGNSGSLGADSSGNGNNWTPTNLAATDQVLDSPTNNFDVLNILDPNADTAGTSFAEGNLKYTNTSGGANQNYGSQNFPADSIDWYFEARCNARPAQDQYTYAGINSAYFRADGQVIVNGSTVATVSGLSVGDILGFAFGPNKGIEIYRNGSSVYTNASHTPNPLPLMNSYSSGSWTFNFGQDSSFAGAATAQGNTDANGIGDFYYSVPSGCLSRCTANLPDPVAAIDPAQDANPQDHFNTVLWTGNGTSGRTVTGVGFQPDIIYYKSRSLGQPPQISDAVRGVYRMSRTNATDAEYNITGGGMLQSFDADGFTVGTDASINQSSQTYVAWNWKANGAGVSNTVGTLASTVSANQDLGVSIVTFTTDGTNTTVGTGLSSSAPLDMVIIKRRDSTSDWQVGHRFSGQSTNFAYHTNLNDTSALSGISPFYLGTSSTTQGHYVQLGSGSSGVSSATWVAYCFQEVDGFSKFGSYTGNGSTDGPFVYCGFRPAFVMIKNASTAGPYWSIVDTAREPFNVTDSLLFPNDSLAELTNSAYNTDLTSNGFKVRTTNNSHNTSGNTYIFMAFAEMPFKYANAR